MKLLLFPEVHVNCCVHYVCGLYYSSHVTYEYVGLNILYDYFAGFNLFF